jgi:hypothetical protein
MRIREVMAMEFMKAMLANPYTGENFKKAKFSEDEKVAILVNNALKSTNALLDELAKEQE